MVWFAILFFGLLFIGLVVSTFSMYEWYQALGITILVVIAPFIFNMLDIEFEWLSYILGYVLCFISHLSIKSTKGVGSKDINIDKKL